MGGGPTAPLAHPLLPPPQPGRHLGSVRPGQPVGAGCEAGSEPGRGGGAGPRAHLPGAAGLAAAARTDVTAPTPAPPCVYVETKMAAAMTALPVRPRTVSQ